MIVGFAWKLILSPIWGIAPGMLDWIGLTDAATEGMWEWDGGGVSAYRNWSFGEPNDFGNEDCAELSLFGGGWNDIGCGGRKPFVCEIAD